MINTYLRRLKLPGRFLPTATVVILLVLAEAALGRGVPVPDPEFIVAVAFSLVGTAIVLWKAGGTISLLAGLSMYANPTVFYVRGRAITSLHFLGGLVIVTWLLRRAVVDKDLRPPPSQLNAPLLGLVLIWLVSWIASYTFWNIRVPTTHRQPLFFVAEFGQLLMFIGLFWATADTVKSEGWTKGICAVIIAINASTFLVMGLPQEFTAGAWNQLPVALALACSLLAFSADDARVKVGLVLALVVFAGGLWRVNRIPVYLASMAVIFVVSFFKSKKLLLLLVALGIVFGLAYIRPLWEVEESLTARFKLAEYAWQMFRDHPVLGIGPTHYRSYVLLYHPKEWATTASGRLLPHNRWLYFAVNTGVLGVLGILWLIMNTARSSLAFYRKAAEGFDKALSVAALASLVGVLVSSVGGHIPFLPTYKTISFHMASYWILLGLMISREHRAGEGNSNDREN